MEKVSFNYLLKNASVPSKLSYQLKLIKTIASLIKSMRLKVFFSLKVNNSNETARETFGSTFKDYSAQCTKI